MIWKNPFLAKNSERQMQDEFLSLFDCTVLQIIENKNLEIVSFVSSTPGAGKTSLFRAFMPDVLNQIVVPKSDNEYKQINLQMKRLGIINNGKVQLLSAYLSCARSYSIIDEMFQNGRRKQIFFALLNYRISIAMLRSIGSVLEIDSDDFERITFKSIPQEMLCYEEYFSNGKTLYEWACEGERELCKYLDSERQTPLDISFVHTTLLMLKIFEPDNILIDKEQHFVYSLLIFDDFHKLSPNQKRYLSEEIYTLKSGVGIWLGQRLEGLENPQIVSMDGSLNRDYNLNIVIDNYWPEKSNVFYSMLESIADRRVKDAALDNYQKFSDCIAEKINEKKYETKLDKYIKAIKKEVENNFEATCRYKNVVNYIDAINNMSVFEKAIWYECIKIKENRRANGQLTLYLGEEEELSDFKEFVKENENGARFYISQKNEIPYYYGMYSLKVLSSYNVEQFLYFASEYFEGCRIKNLEGKRKKSKALSPEEQVEIIKIAVKRKWEDMDYRYSNIKLIKRFLNKIGNFCIASRDNERNSYSGGAYTGIAINKNDLIENINNPRYAVLIDVLGACLASKYLERREINHGEIIVFYLNRWLCVYYQLPLAYGGWKKSNLNKMLSMCEEEEIGSDNQYSFDLSNM